MGIIIMNSENNQKTDPHSILVNLSDTINLKRSDKNILLYKILAHTVSGKI